MPIALDTPGYGSSCAPEQPISITEFADAMVHAIRQLTDDPVCLVGHHTGASIAINIAARYPDMVAKQVLHGVALLNAQELAYYVDQGFSPIEPKIDGSHLQEVWDQRLATTAGWADLSAMHEHVISMLRAGKSYHYGFEAVFKHEILTDLLAVTCPTLVLSNAGDGLHEASKRAVAARPDFVFYQFDEGTRDIIDEQPAEWVDAIVRFLRS